MNVSRRWLEAFLRRDLEVHDVVERLAMLGAPVDAIEPLHADLADVIIGLVEEARPHPNADRLRLCLVNDGTAVRRNVVCGAPNVLAGRKYPFAPIGAVLPGDFTIEKRKIRGETSEGMLCSARELGLGQEHDGILELETEAAPGTRLLDALPLSDDRIVVDVTPNRPDLLGHKGIARELAASYGTPYRLPPIPGAAVAGVAAPRRAEGQSTTVDGVRMAIDDPAGCPRFLGAVIRGVKVSRSPAWLADRISAIGMRPINNVVDATNYVMFELNQPMHPYDIATLRGPSVIVRRARDGETLVTLDDVARTLTDAMTVIADDGGAIGVGGVMGAAHVEVSERTSDVFLECAAFEPRRIRRTRKALGLSTEASHRFERGVDRWGAPDAIRRCIDIILATAGGTMAEVPADLWPQPTNPARIFLRPTRVTQLLGVDFPWSTLEQYLLAIGATVLAKPDDGRMAVDVPGWRPDLQQEIDLIEEIARLHGYNNFPDQLGPYRPTDIEDDPADRAAARVRAGLITQGLFEAQSLPLGSSEGMQSVRVVNPLSAEEGFLRQTLTLGLLHAVEANWSAGVGDIRLFEIGTVFSARGPGERPHEEVHVAAVITGAREPAHWSGGGKSELADLWDLKALFEAAIALAVPDGRLQVDKTEFVAIAPDGREVGRARRLDANVPAWASAVYGLELVLDPAPRGGARFQAMPVTPASKRDVALLVGGGTTAAQIEAVLRRSTGRLLEAATVFDEYRGEKVPSGTRGVGFRLTFRAPDRTLRDEEVDAAVARAVQSLERELGVQLRAT